MKKRSFDDYRRIYKDTVRTFLRITVLLLSITQIPNFICRFRIVGGGFADDKQKLSIAFAYISVLLLPLLFFYVARLSLTYRNDWRTAYLKNEDHGIVKTLGFFFRRPFFWIQLAAVFLTFLIFPLGGTGLGLYQLFLLSGRLRNKFLLLLVLLPILFLVYLLASLSAARVWKKKGNHFFDGTEKQFYGALLAKLSVVTGVALLWGFFITILIFFFPIVEDPLFWQFVIGIVVLLVILSFFRYIGAIWKRRDTLKRIRRYANEIGATLSPIRHPYYSLFFFTEGESFRITYQEETYSCKLIGTRKRSVPLTVTDEGMIRRKHAIRFRNDDMFAFETESRYDYRSEFPKILILSPVPHQVLGMAHGQRAPIDNGDTVGEYKVYTTSGFLRALERGSLDRRV